MTPRGDRLAAIAARLAQLEADAERRAAAERQAERVEALTAATPELRARAEAFRERLGIAEAFVGPPPADARPGAQVRACLQIDPGLADVADQYAEALTAALNAEAAKAEAANESGARG